MTANGIFPRYSRKRVQRAGDAIREGTESTEDIDVLENWRASHAHIINTFQANLRRRTRDTEYLVGQRLKRRATILDKLQRESGMNLARMHDIAGCRVVFPNIEAMLKFRDQFNSSRAKHIRITAERDQFNYLEAPKASGYRGIHDVYKYQSYADAAEAWSGLQIEVQFRTKAQHAWATAVEIADLLTKSRGKFSEAADDYQNFFVACSEIIARSEEGRTSILGELTSKEVCDYFNEYDGKTNLLEILRRTNHFSPNLNQDVLNRRLNTILIYPLDPKSEAMLRVRTISDTRRAIEEYESLEKELEGKADVVLVRAEDVQTLMKVFQNYFTDARDFVQYVDRGRKSLAKKRR